MYKVTSGKGAMSTEKRGGEDHSADYGCMLDTYSRSLNKVNVCSTYMYMYMYSKRATVMAVIEQNKFLKPAPWLLTQPRPRRDCSSPLHEVKICQS